VIRTAKGWSRDRWTEYIRKEVAKGSYSAIVYIDGSTVYAEDAEGNTIAQGEAGVDDASVIQSAIDKVYNDGGGLVKIAKGTYEISQSITPKPKVSIEGYGLSTVLRLARDVVLLNLVYTSKTALDAHIHNITLDGNSRQFTNPLIHCKNIAADFDMSYIYARHHKGTVLKLEGTVDNVSFNFLRIHECGDSAILGAGHSDAPLITFERDANGNYPADIFFIELYAEGNYGEAIRSYGSAGTFGHDIQFIGGKIEGTPHPSYVPEQTDKASVWLDNIKDVKFDSINIVRANSNLMWVTNNSRVRLNNVKFANQGDNSAAIVFDGCLSFHATNLEFLTDISEKPNSYHLKTTANQTTNVYIVNAYAWSTKPPLIQGSGIVMLKNTVGLGYTENSGTATFSGDGTTTQFTIAHGFFSPFFVM